MKHSKLNCRVTDAADRTRLMAEIMSDPAVAEFFFFEAMRPCMQALAANYNRAFGLELTAADASAITYLDCWEESWAKLRTYKGETTPHAWVSRIASQAVYRTLVDEKFIDDTSRTKTSDYRLKLLSIDNRHLRASIVDLVNSPRLHKALTLRYVDKADYETIAREIGSAKEAAEALCLGEKTLIDMLLNTENPYAEIALSLKKPPVIETSLPDQIDRFDAVDTGYADSPEAVLHEIIKQKMPGISPGDDIILDFLRSFTKSLGWNARDSELWFERFINDTPPTELAELYGVRRSWIDNRYSKLNKQFRIALQSLRPRANQI